MTLYRKLPVEIEAVRFRGGNFHEIWAFVGTHNASDNATHLIRNFNISGTYAQWDDSDIVAEVWDELHSTWVGVKDGQWIIRGVQGEFYPCDHEVFMDTYAEVEESPEMPPLSSELSSLLNRYSAESVSGTPDFILSEFLLDSIKAFNAAVVKRADWRGESTEQPALQRLMEEGVPASND